MVAHRVVLRVTLLACFLPALKAQAPSNANAIEAIRVVSQANSDVEPMRLLRTLTSHFGSRLTGSVQEHEAAAWTMSEMNKTGLSHVHEEHWTLHQGWRRHHANARLMTPYQTKLTVASYGWSGSTRGPITGEIVLVDGNVTLSEVTTRGWAGKILLLAPPSKDGIRAVADAPALARWAERAHALAVIDGINRPGDMLAHTGPIGLPAQESAVPFLDMARRQREQLEGLVRQGSAPRMRLDIANAFTGTPVAAENVVGEIEGAVHPEEVVLVAAHLDSWDLSPGATDDGVGVAAVLAAAAKIQSSAVRPDRTIRFVLFTGEEQGLLGSQAYVKQHQADLPNIVCVLAMDWGSGPISRFPLAGHAEMELPLKNLFETEEGLHGIRTSSGFLTFTDGFAFTLAGLPGIAMLQDSPGYDGDAHSTKDTLEEVDASVLRSNTNVLALAAIWLADLKDRPGALFTPSENQHALHSMQGALQMLGMWPY